MKKASILKRLAGSAWRFLCTDSGKFAVGIAFCAWLFAITHGFPFSRARVAAFGLILFVLGILIGRNYGKNDF
jgi:hypothetical protein